MTDKTQLASKAETEMENLLQAEDPEGLANLVAAVAASLNERDCTVPVACDTIGRSSCLEGTSAKTCGPCLEGKIGEAGDSNYPCADKNLIKKLDEFCSLDTECGSTYCDQKFKKCSQRNKSCDANCSGQGTCKFYGKRSGRERKECVQGDNSCNAKCLCNTGYKGRDCSVDANSLESIKAVRDNMCNGIYKTTQIYTDVTLDVIKSRAMTLYSLLMDNQQLGPYGIANCTLALVDTIDNPASLQYIGIEGVSDKVMATLSKVLACDLSTKLAARVTESTSKITQSVQNQMAVGEEPKTITTKNARISASVEDRSTISSKSFKSSRTESEIFENKPQTEIGIDSDTDPNADAVGVSVVQLSNIEDSSNTAVDCPPTGIQLTEYKDTALDGTLAGSGSTRRILSSSRSRSHRSLAATDKTVVKIKLQNTVSLSYPTIESKPYEVKCDSSDVKSDGIYTAICPVYNPDTRLFYNTTHNLECNNKLRTYKYICPKVEFQPKCIMYNEINKSFEENTNCILLERTSKSTTCRCEIDAPKAVSSGSGRRLTLEASGSSGQSQFSSKTEAVSTSSFSSEFTEPPGEPASSSGGKGGSDGDSNMGIIIGSAVGAIALVGVAYYLMVASKSNKVIDADDSMVGVAADSGVGEIQKLTLGSSVVVPIIQNNESSDVEIGISHAHNVRNSEHTNIHANENLHAHADSHQNMQDRLQSNLNQHGHELEEHRKSHQESSHQESSHHKSSHHKSSHQESSHQEPSHHKSSHQESSHHKSSHHKSSHQESSHKVPEPIVQEFQLSDSDSDHEDAKIKHHLRKSAADLKSHTHVENAGELLRIKKNEQEKAATDLLAKLEYEKSQEHKKIEERLAKKHHNHDHGHTVHHHDHHDQDEI